jgi:hypothetical protein
MEGQDANTLIASRLGVEPGDVTAKLVALSQQNVLDGAADGRGDDVDDGATANINISLTLEDLENFERFEAAEKQAVVLKMRPAVLGATPARTPSAAVAAATPAAATPAAATPAVPAVVHLSPSPTPLSQSAPAAPAAPTASALWCEDEVEMAPEEEDDRTSTTATATAEASVSETDAWPERKRYSEAVEAE